MSKTSIIIASRNEVHLTNSEQTVLQRMIQDIYEKATGEFEVLVAFDGPPHQSLPDYPNLIRLDLPEAIGLKPCLNKMAEMATGKYICKFDSHCMVSKSFDEVLQADMEDNWIVTPRFYVLDAENWQWQDERHYDYFYLSNPLNDKHGFRFKAGGHWPERTKEREGKFLIDETMQIHGSCWFLTKDFYLNCLGGMSSDGYGHFGMEPPELCLKTWLGPWDGKVMVNKKCSYSHMHKGGQRVRGWPLTIQEIKSSYDYAANYWMGNQWKERKHDLSWLVEKFQPVPTWPKDWKQPYKQWLKDNGYYKLPHQ